MAAVYDCFANQACEAPPTEHGRLRATPRRSAMTSAPTTLRLFVHREWGHTLTCRARGFATTSGAAKPPGGHVLDVAGMHGAWYGVLRSARCRDQQAARLC